MRKIRGRLLSLEIINYGYATIHLDRCSDRLTQLHVRSGDVVVPADKKRADVQQQVTEMMNRVLADPSVAALDPLKYKHDIMRQFSNMDVECTILNASITDPLSARRIEIPVRGPLCMHVGCFDLRTHIEFNLQAGSDALCPICRNSCGLFLLYVDTYIQSILDEDKLTCREDEERLHSGTISFSPSGAYEILRPPSSSSSSSGEATSGAGDGSESDSESESDYDVDEELEEKDDQKYMDEWSPELRHEAARISSLLTKCWESIELCYMIAIEADGGPRRGYAPLRSVRALALRNQYISLYDMARKFQKKQMGSLLLCKVTRVVDSLEEGLSILTAAKGDLLSYSTYPLHENLPVITRVPKPRPQHQGLRYDPALDRYVQGYSATSHKRPIWQMQQERDIVYMGLVRENQSQRDAMTKKMKQPGVNNGAYHSSSSSSSSSSSFSQAPVNINTATQHELSSIPGLSWNQASHIIEHRQRKKFQRISDLKRVRGIGAATINKLKLQERRIQF